MSENKTGLVETAQELVKNVKDPKIFVAFAAGVGLVVTVKYGGKVVVKYGTKAIKFLGNAANGVVKKLFHKNQVEASDLELTPDDMKLDDEEDPDDKKE